MHIAYFDEVKPNIKLGRHNYVIAGIVVDVNHIKQMENNISEIAIDVFGTSNLTVETEFHAIYLYFVKGPFRGMDVNKRLEIISRLAQNFKERDKIKLVYSVINTSKLVSNTDPAGQAFMHFVERVHGCIPSNEFCIMIGDLDLERSNSVISSFQKYRNEKTPYQYGIKISKIIDTVHFCRSHHSRMIQLADLYSFYVSGKYSERKGWIEKNFKESFQFIDMFPSSYKEWPK